MSKVCAKLLTGTCNGMNRLPAPVSLSKSSSINFLI
jgi:hypothetical protein